MNIREKCERIWEGYKLYASTAYVPRRGFELVGLTETIDNASVPVDEIFECRGESGLEHQAKTTWLAFAFSENFPDFFDSEFIRQPSKARNYYLFYLVSAVVLNHDVGEVLTGDIPDNGNPMHYTKDATEREVFGNTVNQAFGYNCYPMEAMFKQFQDKRTHLGKAMYALDKIEAVLTLLFLESYGHCGVQGDIEKTEQDAYYMNVTRSDNPTDCWAAHVKELIMGYPEEIIEPTFELLRVAVLDVRGEMFEWWDRVSQGKDI